MADDVVGKLIFKVETDTKDAKKGLDSFQEEMKETQSGAKKTEQTVEKANRAISKSAIGIAVAVGTAVIKLGKEIVKATGDIQAGQKAIANATGATGRSLESLMDSAKKVFSANDATFDEVADALGQINTRFGLTGKALEDATNAFLDFADATGSEVKTSVQEVSKVMERWGVEADKLPELLDKLTLAGQKSGISVDALSQSLTSNAGTLQAMGYTMDEAISMMMSFEKSGIDASSVIMGMKKSFEDSAKAGTDAREDWENLLDSIKNSTSEAEANAIAVEAFGNRIATDMVSSLRSGTLSLDGFTDVVSNAGGTLAKTEESAKTTADRIQEFKNSITVALGSLGDAFSPLVDNYLPNLASEITGMIGGITNFITKISGSRTATDDLSTAVSTLSGHLEDYKTATENMLTPLENMTAEERRLYEIEQQRAKLAMADDMKTIGDAYADSTKEIADYSTQLEQQKGILDAIAIALDDNEAGTQKLYERKSELMEKQAQGIALTERESAEFQRLTDIVITRSAQGGKYVKNLEDSYIRAYSSMLDYESLLGNASVSLEASISQLAIAFSDGLLDIDKYSKIYPELVEEIKVYAENLKNETDALGENTDNTNENTGAKEGNADATEKQIEASQEWIDKLKEQATAHEQSVADEMEAEGNILGAYEKRLDIFDEVVAEELALIKEKVDKGEASEEDLTNATLYYANERESIIREMWKKILSEGAKARQKEEEEAKANEEALAKARESSAESWLTKIRQQSVDIRKALATELESSGDIKSAYAIREQIIQDEWDREKALLEEKVAKNEATEADIANLNKYYGNEIQRNNKEKNDAIREQDKKLAEEEKKLAEDTAKKQIDEAEKAKEKIKSFLSSTISMTMSLANQLGDIFGGIADNYQTQLDKIEKARESDIENFKNASDARLEYLEEEHEQGLISDEEYKNNKKQIEDELAKATKERTEKDVKAEKELRRKVDEMSRKAFEAKKATAIAQAIIDGASAIMRGYAELGPIAGSVYAGVQAGLTTAQTIVISNQEYVPSYAVGSKYIPKNQLAMLHEGEMVLTRRDAGKMREIGGVENLERVVAGSVGTESSSLSSMRIDNNLSAVIEVDGTQLGIAVLKNIDNASQFVLR